jgi:uncharacterized protein (TIGR03435 family)
LPFSLLVWVGSHLALPHVAEPTGSGLITVVEEVGQPFGLSTPHLSAPIMHPAASPGLMDTLPTYLLAAWLCGFLTVVCMWRLRWRRIVVAVRKAEPSAGGREVSALRRIESLAGLRKHIQLRFSRSQLEPGIFGIISPVLVWPAGMSERLGDAQMAAVITHEVWHVRRHDNLAAAMHMVVEAIFWFNPLVWWLGARLVEERERACDEGVLAAGSERQTYAESILKTCEFCLESPLACVSGITGADLKKRIVRIMTERLANQLSLGRKLLLAGIGAAVVGGPVVFGLLHAPESRAQSSPTTAGPLPSFEVASIKPNHSGEDKMGFRIQPGRYTASGVPTKELIGFAYDVKDFQISGGPSWINSDRYDIDAKMEDSDVAAAKQLSPDEREEQLRLRVQSLLRDRFNLKLSHETKELPVYALLVAKNGPKLQEAKPGDAYPNGIKGPDGRPMAIADRGAGLMMFRGGQLTGQEIPISGLARMLSHQLGREVIDKTGLTGKYSFTLKWTPDPGQSGMPMGPGGGPPPTDNAPAPDASGPSLFTAIQEQLGLKLESTKGPVEILVIDHIEKPSEN